MSRRSLAIMAFVGSLFLHQGAVQGEQECAEGDTPEVTRERAADAFDAGQQLYDAGEYRRAVEQFQCSHQLIPHQTTLFNIGESAELAGDTALALRIFRQYMETYVEDLDDVTQRVEELERRLEASAEAGEPEAGEPESGEPESADSDTEDGALSPSHDPTETTTAGELRMSGARRGAWATLALGIAFGAAGGALVGVAVSRNNEYLQARSDFEQGDDWDHEAIARQGRAFEASGWALLGVGIASLVASVVLFVAFDGEELAQALGFDRSLFGFNQGPTLY